MKSYTDIEQSKKLTNILPIESSDMCWTKYIDDGNITSLHATVNYGIVIIDYPCWSLAALINVLPKNLNIGRPSLVSNYRGYYWIQYYDECLKPNNYKTRCFSNPVDACVAMIENLHELNLL